jgi:osmotically-inducible protein OsmY
MEPLKRFLIGRTSATDTEIGRQILAELEAQEWTRGATIKLAVNQGIVELDGTITDERLRVGLRTIAENVPGVLGVRDNIAFIEPMAGLMISGPGA